MELSPINAVIEAAVENQLAVSGADPLVEEAAARLLAALRPALTEAAMALASQAAAEVSAQLGDGRSVDVVLLDGQPSLRVRDGDERETTAAELDEDFDARITLRLPPSLKGLVESAAGEDGDSVNQWVVRTLRSGAKKSKSTGRTRVTGTFDL